jgi:hypothetical protein
MRLAGRGNSPLPELPLWGLRASRGAVPWEAGERAPRDATTERVWIGEDPNGLGFEVAVARWTGVHQPTQEALRALHSSRLRKRAVPLCVALYDGTGQAWIFGPMATAPVLGPIRLSQATRILQAALDERSGTAARARVLQARGAFETAEIPGFDSQGLFALRELTYGVPRRPDWRAACERSRNLLATNAPGNALFRGLGFESRAIPGNALLLTAGTEPPRAIAILLRDDESFDAESARFAKSPIYHGLDIARRNNVPWLVVMRGPQVRLYPTSPDVGVGRRGATQTYFGLDLALLDDEFAGYLDLAFSANALVPGGSVDELLEASRDYAVSLGERLRERIYEKVVDPLSTAIARAIAGDATLEEQGLALAYRLTLRILFRLLFQAYAEDTRLLPLHRNERYTKASLKEQARDLAEHPDQPHDRRSTSLWDGLLQVWRVIDSGDEAWGVPAYNGGLFGSDPELHPDGAVIARLMLRNDALGPALAGLLVDAAADGIRGPVDFRALDVRDFGTIYEGLLESGLSVAEDDLTDEGGAWRPTRPGERVDAPAGTPYFHTRSGGRKATGSYFTKPFAVEHILEHALDPALDAHLARVARLVDDGDQAGAARLFFDFRVADLAMGSGHFLVAAIGHIETKYGAFLEGRPIPGVERELLELRDAARAALTTVGIEAEIDRSALLGRQIARRCVYGMDINDIAVELARLAIWVRTFVPGLPMSSLDHQLVSANSLTGIGTIDEAIEALDPDARSGTLTFSGAAIQSALDSARGMLEDAAALKESTSEEAKAAQSAVRRARAAAEPARKLFDAAIAVRLGVIAPPSDFDVAGIGAAAEAPAVQDALSDLARGHFPVLFPEVFLREPAGFDVVLGNPPWEKLHVKADAWWSIRFPGLISLKTAERDERIATLARERPDLVRELALERDRDEKQKAVISSGPYPGIGAAHIDLFAAFAWRNWQLVRRLGRVGVVLPRTAFSGSSLSEWRRRILSGGAFEDVCFITNTGRWAFDQVHPQYTFALSVASKGVPGTVRLSGPFHSEADYRAGKDEVMEVPSREFETWSDISSFPLLPTASAGQVFLQMRHQPRFDSEESFAFRPVQGDVNITTQRNLFKLGQRSDPDEIPILGGGSFALWAPDHGEPYGWGGKAIVDWLLARARKGVHSERSGYYGQSVRSRDDLVFGRARIALRQIARPTDSRTCIVCLMPPGTILASGAHYLHRRLGGASDEAYLLGVMSSIPFDWYSRRWVELNFTFELLNPMPVPRPNADDVRRRRITEIAGRMGAVDERFAHWAGEVGVPFGSVEPSVALELEAELDALVCLLYGLSKEHTDHVFATFQRGWDYSDRLARVLAHYDRWERAAA